MNISTDSLLDLGDFMDEARRPFMRSALGALWQGDCLNILPALKSQCVDTVFADPPFNLGKDYGHKVNDTKTDIEYIRWCGRWMGECARILKPGGSFFLYNLPRWNMLLGSILLTSGLTFRHWIAVSMKSSLPIQGKLYPAHYSLLYFTRGKPKTFRKIRTPFEKCRKCGAEVKDNGGQRGAMNPRGVNLMDVWDDICPVRHRKYKGQRKANALSTKLLDRVVALSTRPGDTVLDPFGGSGTTYAVCERKGRRWLGVEIDPLAAAAIETRICLDDLCDHPNDDDVEDEPC